MPTIDEKRVYGDRTGKTEVYVAASVGVVGVDVSGGQVGGFGVDHRCAARDVTVAGGRLAVATDEDVLLRDEDGEYEATGFGPAVAVGFDAGERGDGGRWLAAAEDGRVARRDASDWETVGRVGSGDGAEVRAIDGPLVAASDGVYRVGDELSYTGLDDARAVAAAGAPLAATGDGLYSLGNGWMDELDGSFRAVAAADGRAHAAAEEGAYVRGEGGWEPLSLPTDERVVDFAYGGGTAFALTEAGTLLLSGGVTEEAEDEWRSQLLGLDDATGVTAE